MCRGRIPKNVVMQKKSKDAQFYGRVPLDVKFDLNPLVALHNGRQAGVFGGDFNSEIA